MVRVKAYLREMRPVPERARLLPRLPGRFLIVRSFACLLLVAAAAIGCSDDAVVDAPSTGGIGGVAPTGGASGIGGQAGSTGGIGGIGGVFVPRCGTSALCPSCPDEETLCDDDPDCPVGTVCFETGCDDLKRCFIIGGGACEGDADCDDPDYACEVEIGRCLKRTPGCDDSNDCVSGFACEDGICADRRVPCVSVSDCPHGYACRVASPDQRFCRRVTRPCNEDLDCLTLGVLCGDADGDGAMECMASFTPNEPDPFPCAASQCADDTAPVCELTEPGTRAVCGRFGLCASAQDCADGFTCRDLWGDGRSECVLAGGDCFDSRDCMLREVCASPRAEEPPTCVGGAAM